MVHRQLDNPGIPANKWRPKILLVFLASLLASCTGMSFVDVPSENQNSRVRYLVIHYTTENFADSLALLTKRSDNPVSAHYLIPEHGDATYPGHTLKIHRLVAETRRAWHAGKSFWHGDESLNDNSIGIELVNLTECDESAAANASASEVCTFRDFDPEQLQLLYKLVDAIVLRHPGIKPAAIVGHADIAPQRKLDPGPLFPWQELHRMGHGAWFDDDTMATYRMSFRESLPPIELLQSALGDYGYRIAVTGIDDAQTRSVVQAFQMHFRPRLFDGHWDAETAAILFALLEKYRPEQLEILLKPVADQ